MLDEVMIQAMGTATKKLFSMLEDDLIHAWMRGNSDVALVVSEEGWRAAGAERDGKVILLGPRRTIQTRSDATHYYLDIITLP